MREYDHTTPGKCPCRKQDARAVPALFSTLVLLGLLAGALVWNREAGYYGLVCIFCILTAWEWRHMLIRSGKAGQARLSFLFGAAYPVLLSVACFF